MLSESERIKIDIAAQKAKIAESDRQIEEAEEAEERQDKRRQHGDKLYNRLIQLEEQLKRAEAPLVKPQGHCVRFDNWDV